jgi:hypothetical protein
MTGRPTKITFAEMRDSGVRGIAPTTSAAPRGLTDRIDECPVLKWRTR